MNQLLAIPGAIVERDGRRYRVTGQSPPSGCLCCIEALDDRSPRVGVIANHAVSMYRLVPDAKYAAARREIADWPELLTAVAERLAPSASDPNEALAALCLITRLGHAAFEARPDLIEGVARALNADDPMVCEQAAVIVLATPEVFREAGYGV